MASASCGRDSVPANWLRWCKDPTAPARTAVGAVPIRVRVRRRRRCRCPAGIVGAGSHESGRRCIAGSARHRAEAAESTWGAAPALAATGTTGIHFHDLRHAGNLLIAHAGANLRELMNHGPLQQPRRADLPSVHRRPAACPRPGGSRSRPHRTRCRELAWHECGTNRHNRSERGAARSPVSALTWYFRRRP